MCPYNWCFGSGRVFCLVIVALVFAGTQACAQTEKDSHGASCTAPACPKLETSLNKTYCAETPLVNGPEADCELSNTIEPASPAPVQIIPNNDRLFFVLPNYLTVENKNQFKPLPVKTKFVLSLKTMTDPVTVSFLGAVALMGQARNSDPTYGQGFQGYGKRYATVYANTGIGTLMTTSVFPTILHQDPRYFQLGTGGKWHRAMYSVSRIFVTRADSGALQFNYSEIVGNAVAAGISNTYLPQSQRTLGNTLSVWGTDILLNTLCNVAKEFWPDLRRKIHKAKAPDEGQLLSSDR
jgi:hypothetical protein